MRKLVGLLSVVCLSACVWHLPTYHEPNLFVVGKQKRECGPFNQVRVEGAFDVELHTGYHHDQVKIQTISARVPKIRTVVQDGILLISCQENCPKRDGMRLRIETRQLRSFSYRGQGEISGRHLHAPYLNLNINNPGSTVLGGVLGLRKVVIAGGGEVTLTGVNTPALDLVIRDHSKVQMAGNIHLANLTLENGSWVSLYWLKADRLTLRAHGKTVVQFAGKAKLLDVELWDHAKFKGRYFTVKEVFVKTHDHAVAEITTTKHQHAFATDVSDIYFYKVPRSEANYMAYNGSVLNMRLFDPKLHYDVFNAFNLPS
ncbi:MAG: DUF2807 domain-containing protein [Gammaproteobacteria bacterium]|nr:DUF2807 domain-containing protein [Gammaproteobacteria bacterium]